MTKLFNGLIALMACVAVGSQAEAHTFFSGIVDVNASNAGGVDRADAKRIGATSGGFGYNNNWVGSNSVGPGAGTIFGAKNTAIGVIPLSTATTGGTTNALNTGLNLVGVYALEGVILPDAGSGNPRAHFDPGTSVPGGTLPGSTAGGVLQFWDRGANAGGLSNTNSNTWTDGGNGGTLLAEVRVFDRADAYQIGPPGPQTTAAPNFVGGGEVNVNTVSFQLGQATQDLSGDFKFVFPGGANPELGTLFADLEVFADFDNNQVPDAPGTFIQYTYDLFTNLEQVLQDGFATPDAAELGDLNSLFDTLLSSIGGVNSLFSDESGSLPGLAGDNFDNVSNNNTPSLTNSDSFVINNGGNAIPGGQFDPIVEPEPTTVMIWSVVGVVGLFAARKLKPAGK